MVGQKKMLHKRQNNEIKWRSTADCRQRRHKNALTFVKVKAKYGVSLQKGNREHPKVNGINCNPTGHSMLQLQPLTFDF